MQEPSEQYIKEHPSHRDFYLERDFPGYIGMLNELYPRCTALNEKLWLRIHGYKDFKKCPICGGDVRTFINFNRGYTTYCSPTCAQKDPQVRLKNHNTNVERHGEDYRRAQAEKSCQTKLEKYGSRGYNNTRKIKETCLERYGVDNPMKSESILNKAMETNMERYGAKFKILTKEYQESRRQQLDDSLIKKHPEIMDMTTGENGLPIFTCHCTDETCDLCTARQYTIGYYMFYERKYIYGTEPCPIKNPPNANRGTRIEMFMRDILESYNIPYKTNDRSLLGGKEVDIYIPDHNLAVECNGIYWHRSGEGSRIDKGYHHTKWQDCKDQGIQLLTFWEDQIFTKQDIVRNILLSHLGIYDHRIGARQCDLVEVPSQESARFLDRHHLQGPVTGSVRLGLYYKDELVALMVFGRKRTALGNRKHDTWELYRYCCRGGWNVVGGASRLFKYFLTGHPGTEVESFSSNDISDGGLYSTLGFEKAGDQTYSYWYIDKMMQRHHRYDYRKNVLVEKYGADPTMTEFEITDGMGLLRIYDTGQQKWICINE